MSAATLPLTARVCDELSPVGAGNRPYAIVFNDKVNLTSGAYWVAYAREIKTNKFASLSYTLPLRPAVPSISDEFLESGVVTRDIMFRYRQVKSIEVEIDRFVGARWLVDAETASLAQLTINRLPVSLPLPQVKPSDDGEIGLFWTLNSNRVEAVFMPEDKRLVWIGKFDGRFESGGDVSWDNHAPLGLLTMLARLYG